MKQSQFFKKVEIKFTSFTRRDVEIVSSLGFPKKDENGVTIFPTPKSVEN